MSQAKKILYRNDNDKMIGGVCSGMSDYLGQDVMLVRILWFAISLFALGLGFWVYVALWILLPTKATVEGLQAVSIDKQP